MVDVLQYQDINSNSSSSSARDLQFSRRTRDRTESAPYLESEIDRWTRQEIESISPSKRLSKYQLQEQMIAQLVQSQNLEHDQAEYCLKVTDYASVEIAAQYLSNKNDNGKYTHKLERLGKVCFVCDEKPEMHQDHCDLDTSSDNAPLSVNLSSSLHNSSFVSQSERSFKTGSSVSGVVRRTQNWEPICGLC